MKNTMKRVNNAIIKSDTPDIIIILRLLVLWSAIGSSISGLTAAALAGIAAYWL